IRTAKEMGEIVRANPFLKKPGIDHSKLHVTFLSAVAPVTATKDLEPLALSAEQFRINGREIYLYCPEGYGRTKLSNNGIEKNVGLVATTRNWKSVNALLSLIQ